MKLSTTPFHPVPTPFPERGQTPCSHHPPPTGWERGNGPTEPPQNRHPVPEIREQGQPQRKAPMKTTQDLSHDPLGGTTGRQAANRHIQAIGTAISDLLNDETIDDGAKANIVAWSWHTAALGDCCGRATHRRLEQPLHLVMPQARLSDGSYLYACPEHDHREWPVGWHDDMLNRLPNGWQL